MSLWQDIYERSRPLLWISAALISVLLLAAVLYQVDWRLAATLAADVSGLHLGAGVALFLLEGVFTSLRIDRLTSNHPGLSACFRVTAWYVVYLILLPARLGEVAAVLLLKRYLNQKFSPAMMNIIVQRLFDVIVLSSILVLTLLMFRSLLSQWQLGLAAAFVIACACGVMYQMDSIIVVPSRRLLAMRRTSKLARKLLRLLLQARIWHRHRVTPSMSQRVMLLTLGKWFCSIGGFVFLLMAISLPLSFAEAIALAIVFNFLAIIPIQTIGGIGVSEVGLTGMLTLAGLTLTWAASATVLIRVVLILVPFVFWCAVMATLRFFKLNALESA